MFAIQKQIIDAPVCPKGFRIVAIEQFAGQDFNNNPAGWTRNDIAQLAAATTKSQYDAIVQRLSENKGRFNIPDDMTMADAVKVIQPRYCQSPLEIQQFAEHIGQMKLDDAYAKALKDVKVDEEPDVKPVEKPVDAPVVTE